MEIFKRKQFQSSMDLVQKTENVKEHSPGMLLFDVLLCAGLSVGCWYTFFSMFPNPVNSAVTIVLIAGLPVGMYFLFRNRYVGKFLAFYVFIITAVLFVLFYKDVWNGFLVMANIVTEVLNNELNAGLIPFATTGDTADWASDAMLAMIPVMILAATGISYSVYNREPILGFVLSAIPVLVGLCLKVQPSIWLLILLLTGWTGLLVISAVARPASRKKNRPVYIQSDDNSSLPYIFIGITLVLLLGYVLVFSGDDYIPAKSVDEAKASVIEMEEHLRYDNLGGSAHDQLSRGDLNDTHPLEYTDTVVMNLDMQMPQSMYLRGFAGGYFEDGKWSEAAEGAYSGEYTGAMEWLAQQYFYPWMQQERLYRMSANYDYVDVTVENVNTSSKYMYLPYEAAMTGDTMPSQLNYEKDYAAYNKGLRGDRSYTFTAFLSRFEDYDATGIAAWLAEVKQHSDWDDYAGPEAVYRRYVYDTYLYIDKDDYEVLKKVGAEACMGRTIEYTLHYIRSMFDAKYTYDTDQGAAPAGNNELEYFLTESRSGNDMHFATAAALMFRSAGIPARYAEGYYLSPKQMLLYDSMSDVKLDVLDSDAHAWVEIYIDEIGWFPVEVIPGFFSLAKEQSEEVEDKEQIQEDTKKNFEDEVPEMDEPEKNVDENDDWFRPWMAVVLMIILLIAMFEYLGRRRTNRMLDSFGKEYTDGKVYEMYRYMTKLMALDGHKVPADPYDAADEIESAYEGADELTFAGILRLVNRVRFGKKPLTEEEHKKMASYVMNIRSYVYNRQNKFKKFVMKFILFCV